MKWVAASWLERGTALAEWAGRAGCVSKLDGWVAETPRLKTVKTQYHSILPHSRSIRHRLTTKPFVT